MQLLLFNRISGFRLSDANDNANITSNNRRQTFAHLCHERLRSCQAHVGNEFLGRVQKLARFMRWTACSVIQQVYEACFNDPSRQFPEASTLFFLWTAVEDLGYSFSCCWRLSICDSAKDVSLFFSD